MKRTYNTPMVEKIEFQYRDQVVVASGLNNPCEGYKIYHSNLGIGGENYGSETCFEITEHKHFKEWPNCSNPML